MGMNDDGQMSVDGRGWMDERRRTLDEMATDVRRNDDERKTKRQNGMDDNYNEQRQ